MSSLSLRQMYLELLKMANSQLKTVSYKETPLKHCSKPKPVRAIPKRSDKSW